MTFGEKIRESRITLKLTQKQLADKIGAKHNSISDWENDKNKPDPNTIELLCGVLNISPNYLLGTSSDEFSLYEKEIIKKYRALDTHGKELVNVILEKEHSRCCDFIVTTPAGPLLVETVSSTSNGSERASRLLSYASAIAAHNDHTDEPGEQEKMLEDISNLKRPE